MINSKSELINYLTTAYLTLRTPLILEYLTRAEQISSPEELEELCQELGV